MAGTPRAEVWAFGAQESCSPTGLPESEYRCTFGASGAFACPEAQVTRAQRRFPAGLLACVADATFVQEVHLCGVSAYGSEY